MVFFWVSLTVPQDLKALLFSLSEKSDLVADFAQPPKFPQSHTDSQTSSNTSEIREINHKILFLHHTKKESKSNFCLQLFSGLSYLCSYKKEQRSVEPGCDRDGTDGSTAQVMSMTPYGGTPTSCSEVPPYCTAAAPPPQCVTYLPLVFCFSPL